MAGTKLDSVPGTEVARVPIDTLRPADSPRRFGPDEAHAAMLAGTDAALPPIVVHRATMRVIDGTHRVHAARLTGATHIDARFFDGDEHEAFILAVTANIAHGLPLSSADRTAAAARILRTHPQWSDRRIAAASGLSRRTVATLRARATGTVGQSHTRIGIDGRARPLSGAEGRRRAADLIRRCPDASLRQIAAAAGISVSTVRVVRDGLRTGRDPDREGLERRDGKRATELRPAVGDWDDNDRLAARRALARDPSLRLTGSGRRLLFWLNAGAAHLENRAQFLGAVPPYCAATVAKLARSYAALWQEFADELDRQNQTAS